MILNLKKSTLITALLTLGILISTVSFQNCSKVPLELQSSTVQYSAKGSVSFCLDGPYANYTVKSYTVSNLNIVNSQASLLPDTDGDGLSDVEEKLRGSNPYKRYSNGPVLDSICLSLTGTVDCHNINLSCIGTDNKLGLKDCDIQALGLDHSTDPDLGLDSDGDGIVDFIEVIKGTSANVSDATADPDKDLVLNQDEIHQGSNPLYSDRGALTSAMMIKSNLTQKVNAACAGETWDLKIDQVPLLNVPAFTDIDDAGRSSNAVTFSHAKDENIILISLLLSVKNGYTGNTIVLTDTSRASLAEGGSFTLNLRFQDFKKAGEVNP